MTSSRHQLAPPGLRRGDQHLAHGLRVFGAPRSPGAAWVEGMAWDDGPFHGCYDMGWFITIIPTHNEHNVGLIIPLFIHILGES